MAFVIVKRNFKGNALILILNHIGKRWSFAKCEVQVEDMLLSLLGNANVSQISCYFRLEGQLFGSKSVVFTLIAVLAFVVIDVFINDKVHNKIELLFENVLVSS